MKIAKRSNAGENDISFWMPLELEKSKDEKGNDKLTIKGVASTIDKDSDDEVLDPKGFDLTYLNKSGFLNWNHGAKFNPNLICGEPTKAVITKRGLEVEGLLYPTEIGKGIYELADTLGKHSKNRRLGFSIEGKALERDPLDNKKITKAAITGIAITHMPKNGSTFLDVVKGVSNGIEAEYEIIEVEELLKGGKKKKKKLTKEQEDKIASAMEDFNKGCMKGDDGEIITDKKAALAKAYSDAGMDKNEVEEIMKTLSTGTESGEAVRRESLDDGQRETIDNDGSISEDDEETKGALSKGEVLSKIFSDFPDIEVEKAEKIYRLVEQTSLKMNKDKNTTQEPTNEAIEKAYEAMGLNIDGTPIAPEETIEKSKDTAGSEGAASTTIQKSDDNDDDDDGEEGGESEEGEEGEEMEKGGKKKTIKKAIVVDDSLEKASQPDILKGMQSIANSFTSALESNQKTTNELVKSLGLIIGDLKKGQETFQETIKEELDIIKSMPINGRKSFSSQTAIEKSFGDGDIQKSMQANGGKMLSKSSNKQELVNILSDFAFSQSEEALNDPNNALVKGLGVFESSSVLLPEVAGFLKMKNIHVVD